MDVTYPAKGVCGRHVPIAELECPIMSISQKFQQIYDSKAIVKDYADEMCWAIRRLSIQHSSYHYQV